MKPRPTLVVLAAGRGTRFRGAAHKLEQSLGTISVLGSVLRAGLESGLPMLVVTTEALAPLAVRWVALRDVLVLGPAEAARGLGDSIAAGVSARPEAHGWLLLPGDMPLVRAATLQRVAAALDQHAVAVPQHQGRRGHPAGFAGELYSELIQLSGDDGARRLAARYPVHAVPVDDPGVLLDVDTEADLARLRALGDAVHRLHMGGPLGAAEPSAHDLPLRA